MSEKNSSEEAIHLDKHLLRIIEGERILCLVDGQHYLPVVRWTLGRLEELGVGIVGLVFLGGTEKIKSASLDLNREYGYDTYINEDRTEDPLELISMALEEKSPNAVVDLSDEPVVDYSARFKMASVILGHGITYLGSDFVFNPPRELDVLNKPSLSIIGTGKRVGKTSIGVTISRLLKNNNFDPVVVCMGRGGPPEPTFLDSQDLGMDADTLLEMSRKGKHAASDYWEDALLGQVPTIGCRRCGGGMIGNPFSSSVLKGAALANEIPQSFVVMEGSGPTFPPVRTDKRIVVVGAGQPLDNILNFLGEYRIRKADLAVITMCEEPIADEDKVNDIFEGIKELNPYIEVLLTVFRPEPLEPVEGKKIFVATTAREEINGLFKEELEDEHGCEVVGISNNLSNRPLLKDDLEAGLEEAEVLLTEIKAASIDVAARQADERGMGIVFLHNRPAVVGGTTEDLDGAIISVCEGAFEENRGKK